MRACASNLYYLYCPHVHHSPSICIVLGPLQLALCLQLLDDAGGLRKQLVGHLRLQPREEAN